MSRAHTPKGATALEGTWFFKPDIRGGCVAIKPSELPLTATSPSLRREVFLPFDRLQILRMSTEALHPAPLLPALVVGRVLLAPNSYSFGGRLKIRSSRRLTSLDLINETGDKKGSPSCLPNIPSVVRTR